MREEVIFVAGRTSWCWRDGPYSGGVHPEELQLSRAKNDTKYVYPDRKKVLYDEKDFIDIDQTSWFAKPTKILNEKTDAS